MNDNYFAELQMLSMSSQNTIVETRLKLDRIAEIFQNRPEQEEWLEAFAYLRHGFPVEALKAAGAFAVNYYDTPSLLPEELQHDSLGFVSQSHLVFRGRLVYPVKDTQGHVAGWCGYDMYEQPKYLDSVNYGYHAKDALFYGAEALPTYYRNNRTVFVVEGIVCCLWLRSQGFQALASLGSYLTPYMVTILKRLGRRCVIIPDADEAGLKYRKQVSKLLPVARCLQSCIAKDIDDSRQLCPDLAGEIRKLEAPFGRSKLFN
jgi:hypothetical protein